MVQQLPCLLLMIQVGVLLVHFKTIKNIFSEVSIFLNGKILSNNSIVPPGDIGEGSGALYCLTDRTQCCSTEAGEELGVWRSPDGSDVSGSTTADVYIVRGFSSLLLNSRSSVVGPTGVYTCVIPDAGNNNRTLYIGLYDNAADSELKLMLFWIYDNSCLGIEIIGNEEAHQIGSSINISCSSVLAVQTIRWLNNSQLINESVQQQLFLHFDRVSLNLSNAMYTCKVILEGTGKMVARSITVQVNSNNSYNFHPKLSLSLLFPRHTSPSVACICS